MANLGRKYSCYSCHTKFYDLGKAEPLCPKCGADQREADEAPVYTPPRRAKAVVEEPAAIEEEFEGEDLARPEVAEEEEEEIIVDQPEEVDDDEEEEL